jgi:Tfp pilus assembly protein PilO
MSDIGQFAMFFAVGLMGLGFFFGPIGRAAGRWIESHSQKGSDPERFRELEIKMAELEANCERMAEIEERLDFAERMLAQQREVDRLPEGQS